MLNSYQFAANGTQFVVYAGTTSVVELGLSGTPTGQALAFADGSATVIMAGFNAVTLGGASVASTAGTVAATLNTTDKSTVGL